ncbi:MAG: hypothetical protein LH477_02735 [Nocardioides sp.]|nr:hypothetical protein [Nocardioides sp.]
MPLTRPSASSPWADQGWASRCCAGCSTPCHSPAAPYPICGPRGGRATDRPPHPAATSRVTVRGLVPELHRHLAAADLAVVQGGLTTCMELAASRRPFLYVPLRHHFEQNFHVRHRLERYRAGRCLPYEQAGDPDALAATIAADLGREVDYLPVETDGAARAAALLADLL